MSKVFFFTSYVNNKGSFPKPLSSEDEKKYLEAYKECGDEHAKEMLIRHNLRLVVHIAKKYTNSNAEADDLLSVGSIGLIKGINSFQFGKGSALATYAAKCIENEMLMYLRANKKHKCNVSIYESIGVDKDGNEITRMDVLPAHGEEVEKEVETRVMYQAIIKDMLNALSEREQNIVSMRYGLDGDKPLTQIEVAEKLGICRSYVSRIEKKAIKKLNQVVESKGDTE
ncbi:MAG: RNA polymerase sporulation sigma factor SigK [Firmicutes bacterium]|nr:RNA polymerase sporulation sigma factor SigK [Bacillota bacterium]